MKKLISMEDYVLEVVQTPNINEAICWEQTEKRLHKIYTRALLLKDVIEKWMFVPCKLVDGVWVVLVEPRLKNYSIANEYLIDVKAFKQAQQKVLFEGFEVKHGLIYYKDNVIDDECFGITKVQDLLTWNLTFKNHVSF